MICTTPLCNKKALAKGLCSKCYYRVKRGGTVEKTRRQLLTTHTCTIAGCNEPHVAHGYCSMHNGRFLRHGDPNYINPRCIRDGNSKERRKLYYNKWLQLNWKKQMAYRSLRKKRVKLATPKWADKDAIIQFYINCPEGYHVDHIIPLNGKIVSGLHVIDNLQYLPAIENLKKGNKFA